MLTEGFNVGLGQCVAAEDQVIALCDARPQQVENRGEELEAGDLGALLC